MTAYIRTCDLHIGTEEILRQRTDVRASIKAILGFVAFDFFCIIEPCGIFSGSSGLGDYRGRTGNR